jgi:two-component system sensor histidine kinase RpfC
MVDVLHNNRLSVLLAHDSEGWQENVRRLLEPQGVETLAVRSGREALDLIQNRQIHVAILDQQMPQLGGLQVIKLMRDLKTAPTSILLANHRTDHLLHEALGMHVFSVLSKPVDLNMLLDALARILKKRYASRWPSES